MMARFVLWSLVIGSLASNSAMAEEVPADFILQQGKIFTADDSRTMAEALAIRGERIVAVGKNAEVLLYRGPQTTLIDLGGGFVLPGLIDSHVHASGAAMFEFDHEVPEMASIADVLAYVRQRAAVVPEGEWINLQQVFITRLKEQRYPTKAELDAAAPKHPVAFRTGPDASANTLALNENGIDKAFAAAHSDQVHVDASGEPTGLLRKYGSILKTKPASTEKKPTQAERDTRLVELLKDYNSVGITGAIDRNCTLEGQEQFARLELAGQLSVRMRLSRAFEANRPLDQITKDLDAIAADPLFDKGSDRLKIIGIKVFLDGGMLTGSAFMSAPWGVSRIYGIEDPAYRGMRYIPDEFLVPVVRECARRNLAFTAHSVGDGAVSALLDAYATVNKELPIEPTHSTLTHSNFMSADSVRRCAELGIGVDIQPAWLYLDSHTLVAQFGEQRLRYFQPLSSLFAAKVHVGGGSDHMQKIGSLRSLNFYNPFLAMQVAITRMSRFHPTPLHIEEALTREQAIRFYTINNAWLMRSEKEIGSIEVGKRADFIRVDRDLLTCPVEEIRETRVLSTWVDGRCVFEQK